MSDVAKQVHGKFKVFIGTLGADGALGKIASDVEAWVKSAKVAPKSIGVEYLESAQKIILSVGYRDDEAPYAVQLASVKIGTLGDLDAPGLARLEQAMGTASAKLKNIICHELYVTDSHDLLMVFMLHRG